MCVAPPATEGGLFEAATDLSLDQPSYGHCEVVACRPQLGVGDRILAERGQHPGHVVGSCNVAGPGGPGRCVATSDCRGMCVYGDPADTLAEVLANPGTVAGCGDTPYGTCCPSASSLSM